MWRGHGAGSLLTLTFQVLCSMGQPPPLATLAATGASPSFFPAPWFQGCLTSCPITFGRAMWTLPLAVPGPGAQWLKTKSSRLALDSTSLGTCPSRPSRWPQCPGELRAGKEEAWHPDQACPDVASRHPGIFLRTPPPTERLSAPAHPSAPTDHLVSRHSTTILGLSALSQALCQVPRRPG